MWTWGQVKEVLKNKRSWWRKTNKHWCTENTSVRVLYLRHGTASKYSFENGKAAANNHVITDVLHDASGLTSHQSEQDRGWKEKGTISYSTTSICIKLPTAIVWKWKEISCHLCRGSRRGRVHPDLLWWSRHDQIGWRWDPRTRGQNTTPPSDGEHKINSHTTIKSADCNQSSIAC